MTCMSPAPLGKPTRDQAFLLRMTGEENAYVRECAVKWGVSLNTAICTIIAAAKARGEYDYFLEEQRKKLTDPAQAPQAPQEPPAPPRPTRKARAAAKTPRRQLLHPPGSPSFEAPIPGQTAIDTDEEDQQR